MPTYDYSGETAKKFDNKTVMPGHRFTSEIYFEDDDLGLVSHLPQATPEPIKTFFSDDIVAGEVQDVSVDVDYPRIVIYNICGGILRFYVNEDSDNAIVMPNNSFWTLDNREKKIGEINLSGESAGRVDISADRNII